MRIHKIRLSNIHSLMGQHEVDFDRLTDNNNGLFLIVGATGSGKSSLLDVITLALYNRLPRLAGRISESDIEQLGSIVTHHQSSSFAEVEYSVKEGRYLSRWSITSKQRGAGGFRPVDHELFSLPDGKKLNDKKSEVEGLNEKIIGLKYDQFIKSIMLSQGQFANFLHADKKDRTELMTKLTGTEIYSRLGVFCFEWHKKQKQLLEQMEIRVKDISLLSAEDEKHNIHRQAEISAGMAKLEEEYKQLTDQLSVKNELNELLLKSSKLDQSIVHLHSKQEQLKDNEKKILRHEALMPYLVDIQLYQERQRQRLVMENDINQNEKQKATIDGHITAILTSLEKVCNVSFNEKDPVAIAEQRRLELQELTNEIKQARLAGKNKREEFNELSKLANVNQINISADPERAIQEIDLVLDKHKSHLSTYHLTPEADHTAISMLQDELHQSREMLKEYLNLKNQAIILEQKKMYFNEQILLNQQIFQGLENEITVLNKQLSDNKSIYNKLEEEKYLQAQSLRIDELRHLLKESEPCPLCGSLEHPLAGHKTVLKVGELEIQIIALKKEMEIQSDALSKAEKQVAGIGADLKNFENQYKEVSEENIRVNKLLTILKEKQSDIFLSDTADDRLKQLEIQLDDVRLLAAFHQKLPYWHQWRSLCISMQQLIAAYQSLEEKRKAISPEENAISLIDDHLSNLRKYKENASIISSHLMKNKEQLAILEGHLLVQTQNLLISLQQLGYTDIIGATEDILVHDIYMKWKAEAEDIKQQLISLQVQKSGIMEEFERLTKTDVSGHSIEELQSFIHSVIQKRNENNQELGVIRERLRNNEENKLKMATLGSEIENQRKQVHKWDRLRDLIGDATGHKFANFAQDITLRRLLALCNNRLQSLSDRYMLTKADDQDDLYVVDRYFANKRRSVKTLSGGESFLVSLSLALALSEMASRDVRIESLFIDEGFGTLDKDTLELAMETLDKLRYESGKTIGIISHVESLKDRIPTQIRLRRDAQGYSSVELVGG